ncbi:LysR family transcriptional regulator [Photobacterium sp. SDRW27]|uniref:LysR family transcriptional regulator n=1 Tax=Photobacterium obscurum TaxID=2829490 RepID=UPI00224389FE|nr:LysR family transcriptional regulator [Photobacterium obscurum]MCW8328785.1 LysR family transcriptional regulator [Photobacterium obscurum]
MKRKIDLVKAMRTFLVVVEQQSFSAASRQLNLVTSAVSRQVSDLEKHFGCQLLYRTTRAMHLTAEGRYYLEQFKDVIMRLDNLETNAHQRQKRIAGHIRLTAPFNSGHLGVQYLLSDFLKQYPEVKLSWMLVNRYVNIVEEGIDLAIRVGELPDSSLIGRKIDEMKVLFVASPNYLEQHGVPSHPKELMTLPCVIDNSNRQPGKWRYIEGKKEQHVNVNIAIEVNQGELVAQFAASGHGVAQLPEFLVQPLIESGELIPLLTEFNLTPLPVSLVYPANRLINPALKALIDYILEHPLKE